MKRSRFRFSIIIYLFIVIFSASSLCLAEEKYYPPPIVFVHGFNSSPSAWNTAKNALDDFFYEDSGKGECKYFSYGGKDDYLILIDYELPNGGHIPTIAKNHMNDCVSDVIQDLPEGYKKINIVAHSMGGLVTRSLLKQFSVYEDNSNINRVIFIGTPHRGSPYASAVWILNKIFWEVLRPMTFDHSAFYSKNVGSRFTFADESSILTVRGLSPKINNDLKQQIEKYHERVRDFLDIVPLDTWELAFEQMRLDENVWFQKVLSASFFNKADNVIFTMQINGSKTFLGKASENLATPSDFKIIRGKIAWWDLLNKGKVLLMNQLIDVSSNDFTFPEDSSLEDAKDTGDGVVTKKSQEGIGKADYTIDAFHTDETFHWQTILQAIEEKPIIERIYAIAVDESDRKVDMKYYILVKVKDYLLADIELEYMTLNGKPIIPDSFKDNKPYNAYPKKDFLKSREGPEVIDIDGNPTTLKLEPGEFYVKAPMAVGKNTLRLKIKNPAEEYAKDGSFTDKAEVYFSRTKIEDLYFVNDGGSSMWDWYIDVPTFDEEENPKRGDVIKNYGTLKHFTVRDELFRDMKLSLRIWHRDPIKNFIDGQPITLSGGSEGNHYKEFQNFIVWYGKDNNGRYVLPGGYTIQIITQPLINSYIYPHSNPPITEQLLISTNLDIEEYCIIIADPTFIQPSRRTQVAW